MAHVLVLEDDPGLRLVFAEALRRQGDRVDAVGSCAEAIAYLRCVCPSLVVLDLKIGSELSLSVADYAALRYPQLPVLCVTGCGMFAHGELFALSPNISCVLRKPVSIQDFRSTVQHMCTTLRCAAS
ncbi:two-component response regulator VirG [Tritonibacter multivorans]|uniref:Two-component response regulator VirG n=1 Tax=Tritonibacter multivorans TaxID=928856 RepID=A0A0P1GR95_9RHOB|nr:response regulator [Tritonibacter multivorans]MDA7422624.1 response regulator [Tritonibacter multivorans]CUH77107.1 two-component response regulator VirG [Tritonibacter multivorans]SFD50665.1 Response regulator receiver domain-containing protein [Tritonibacter multivorans]